MDNNTDKKKIIDASVEIDRREKEVIRGERGRFDLGAKRRKLPLGAKSFLLVILVVATAVGGFFIWKTWQLQFNNQGLKAKDDAVRNTLPPLKTLLLAPVTEEVKQPATPIQDTSNSTENPEQISPEEALKLRRLGKGLNDGATRSGQQASSVEAEQTKGEDNKSELQSKLQPLVLEPSAAGIAEDMDYLITQGAMIDCQLETRMITTQPGMASCYTTRNIYSTNGRVILIDRGSKIVGNYQGGMQQGQARIFVLWTRIETPKGVIINLDSPGTGSLGEGGVGGNIDTHFWQRFGGSIMISLIGDFGQYLSNKGQSKNSSNNTTISFSNTTQGAQQAATEALKNSINIPPTLYKNQGERISIFVARDLNFRKVYGLKYR